MKDQCEWAVNPQDGRVYFKTQKKEQNEIPALKMITVGLEYATEMNRII